MSESPEPTSRKAPKSTSRAARPKGSKGPARARWRVWLRRVTFAGLVTGVAAVGAGFVALNSVEIPDPTRTVKTTSFVCAGDVGDGQCSPSNSVAQFSAGGNKRVLVGLDEISPNLINAVVAAEDRSFFTHGGVDPWGIARALYRDLRGSASRQGGSTITQQLVKQVYLNADRTPQRKLKEAAIAIKLERKLSKREILERYLNEVYLGRGAVGVEAASRAYFDKDAGDLTIAESAYLAGLIRAPKYADEPTNTAKPAEAKEAKRRRRTVLTAMAEENYITAAERTAADRSPFVGDVLDSPPPSKGTDLRPTFAANGGWYVMDWVRSQLKAMPNVGETAMYTKGLRIYLTIDPRLQQAAQQAIGTVIKSPQDPAAALVSVDDGGRIRAMIGGQNHDTATGGSEVNLALGKDGGGSGRSPGSTFKPIALAEYVAEGNSVKSLFWAPALITFPKANDGQDWPVKNYEDEDFGLITLDNATWHSANTVYAQVMQKITPKNFSAMALKLGIRSEVKQVQSSVLGTSEVSVLDMTAAYSTFANHGTLKRPYVIRRVEASDGTVLYDAATDPAYAPVGAIDPGVADTVSSVLTGVLKNGTGTRARIKQQAAGKTGTTQDHKDAWFVGFTCRVTTAVWMGYPGTPGQDTPLMDNFRGIKVTGGTFPAQIWKSYMDVATAGTKGCSFKPTDFGTTVNPADDQYAPTTTTTPPPATVPASPGAGGAGTATTAPATTAPPG
ncbi:MAG: transglycosylase domain-containing protein [Acidimicrobiales bacterium]